MKERPILFSAPMVRAILEGRKSQTRRVVKPHPAWADKHTAGMPMPQRPEVFWFHYPETDRVGHLVECPYGVPGGRLWVRETWWDIPEPSSSDLLDGADTWPKPIGPQEQRVAYAADADDPDVVRRWGWKLRPSIFMPRWASRITLEVTDVRVQRVQEISFEDAKAEGCDVPGVREFSLYGADKAGREKIYKIHADLGYRPLWDSINAKRGFGWDVNPWVWAITFKRIEDAA